MQLNNEIHSGISENTCRSSIIPVTNKHPKKNTHNEEPSRECSRLRSHESKVTTNDTNTVNNAAIITDTKEIHKMIFPIFGLPPVKYGKKVPVPKIDQNT
ncbi:hypothetical protein COX64_01970 [Candidatus Dojkabacteria bacterium CG_4_10_14_0_2_um_filter_Dojkabacteria_WS6_41_15]|uniref:Uncharacterized protein n=1 Tax=Candidatus Dojkabacteria bacterium CG_4_10_14_0_2_um_filter_Dojkabacteria_WS6_41_15 TaxID=2014249 RepID=A0A2M7W279_9BACT|nr:MAG: hypothetical protein COX64_01970 [Candidatus Dojkabacteria bacterium CG_4_10_14_0_2_um_filter_Dojkabacteria_WS6_41_15]